MPCFFYPTIYVNEWILWKAGVTDNVRNFKYKIKEVPGGNQVTFIPKCSTGDKTLYARWEYAGELSITNKGSDTFTITRSGGSSAQRVYFRTANGTAVGNAHFVHNASFLDFNSGETAKTVTIAEKSDERDKPRLYGYYLLAPTRSMTLDAPKRSNS